jgi:nucleotide-binding universal stress UspA family protein
MGKRFLVALDYSENAARAVDFVAKTFSTDHEIILFSVIPSTAAVCELQGDSLIPTFTEQQEAFCQVEAEKKMALETALERARQLLLEAGFPEENVQVKTSAQKRGVARDIVEEVEQCRADMLVMGRRGISGFKEFFLGSVSQKVLQLCKETSVLLVQ